MANTSTTRLTCNGFHAWISVGNEELEQYGVEQKGQGEASCWIASEINKAFTVNYFTSLTSRDHYAVRLYLDGTYIGGPAILTHNQEKIRDFRTQRVSETEVRDFTFGPLELTDDDAYLENNHSATQNIGEIKLTFHRVEGAYRTHKSRPINSFLEAGKVHERSKKSLAHQVKLGEVHESLRKVRHQKYCITKKELLATVDFKYRPLAMLQANGLVPYIPSHQDEAPRPQSLASTTRRQRNVDVKPDISNDDNGEDDEGDDITARERTLLAELEKVRKEKRVKKEAACGRPTKKLKTEPPTYKFVPGEIIDLTI